MTITDETKPTHGEEEEYKFFDEKCQKR